MHTEITTVTVSLTLELDPLLAPLVPARRLTLDPSTSALVLVAMRASWTGLLDQRQPHRRPRRLRPGSGLWHGW